MSSLIEIEFYTDDLHSYAFISYLLEAFTLKKDAKVEYKDGDIYNYCAFCEMNEEIISRSKEFKISKTVALDRHLMDISIYKTIDDNKCSVIALSVNESDLLECFPNIQEIQKFVDYIIRRQFEMYKFKKCLIRKESSKEIIKCIDYVNGD